MPRNNLPNDLILRTLARLPVKPLIRFKCVSKTWCSLIEDPLFIEAHLNFSHSTHKSYFLQHSPLNLTYTCDSDFMNYERVECSEFIPSRVSIFLGSSSGVVLLGFGRILVLWNPSIRKFLMTKYPDENTTPETLAVAVNSCNGEHEVAGIFKSGKKLVLQAFSLSRQEWRKIAIGGNVLSRFSRTFPENVFINGDLHCIAQRSYTSSDSTLSLDLKNRVLKEIDLPEIQNPNETTAESMKKVVGEFQGLLSLFIFFHGENGEAIYYSLESCDIWVMKDSWIKFHTVEFTELDSTICKSVGVGWNNKILMLGAMSFVSFDLENRSFKRFEVDGCRIICPYTQSLVLSKEGFNISECEEVLCKIWGVDHAEYVTLIGWVKCSSRWN